MEGKEMTLADMKKLADWIEDNTDFRANAYQTEDWKTKEIECYIELEYYTEYNEDCVVAIWGNTVQEFKRDLESYIDDFDEEEYERPWIEMSKAERREKHAPESIKDLLASAEEFYEQLKDLLEMVKNEYKPAKKGRGRR